MQNMSYLFRVQTDTWGMWQSRLVSRVLVRHCTPVVFPLSISQSSSAVYSEVNHVQRPGRDVCFPPAPVSKMNCLIHLKLEIESRLRIGFSGAFMFWKFMYLNLVLSRKVCKSWKKKISWRSSYDFWKKNFNT